MSRIPRPSRRLAALALALSLAGMGCGSGPDQGSGRTVTLVTYAGYAVPAAAAKAFTERTGITIKVRTTDDAGAALSAAILTAGRPEGDVFFGVDNTFLTTAQGSDAFETYRPVGLDDVRSDFRLDTTGRFTPVDESDVCVDVDRQWFDRHHVAEPTDLASLTDPAYKDLLVVEDPAASSPGLAFLAATRATFGSGTDDYWRRLRDNGVVVAAGWDDAWNSRYSVNGGDRPLVVSYASSPPAEVVYSEGKLKEPRTGVLTATCFRQVEFAAVLRGAPHRDAARQLVDEMLSTGWQEGLPLSNFVYPVVPAAQLPTEFTRWAVRVEHPITTDAARIGRDRQSWIDAWRAILQ